MWNVRSLHGAVILGFALSVSLCSGQAAGSEPEAAQLVRAVRAGENWIHEIDSLYIRIESKSTRTPEAIAAKRAGLEQQFPDLELDPDQFPELRPVSTQIFEYALDRKRVRYLNERPNNLRQLKIWDGEQLTVHQASLPEGQEQYSLESSPQGSFQDFLAFETSWPRAQPHSFPWDQKDVDELLSYHGRCEDFAMAGRCSYRGVDCYSLEVQPTGIPGLVTVQSYPGCEDSNARRQYGLIGQARGLAGQSYRWYIGVEDRRLYGLVWLSNKKPRVEYWMSDYRQVHPGCWLPMTQGCEVYEKDIRDQSYVDVRHELRVVDVRINEQLADELFKMQFKEGIEVVDNRSGRKITYTYRPDPPDLVGKALPKFADIGVSFIGEQAQNGPMLVCFWDMQQRPSRHCVRTLAEKAGVFADKGVTVLCVHASDVDGQTLNGWMRDYRIPFRAQTIAKDTEKARFTWGVESLPWLILTDSKHTVRAEGFAVNELDDKLR